MASRSSGGRKIPSRNSLPRGMTLVEWDFDKEMIREVLWQVGTSGGMIGYMRLCQRLALMRVNIHHRSLTLTGLLNEIALEERERGAPCWITAVVVLTGERYAGPGFFTLVAERQCMWTSKTRFCEHQRHLAGQWMRENSRSAAA